MMKCFQKFAVFRPARAFSTFGEPPRVIQRRVVVTGMGVVTPLATGVDLTWQRLLAKHSGLRALRVEDLKVGGEQSNDELLEMLAQMPSKVVAGVCYGSDEGEFNPELWFQGKDARSLSPFIAYALCAAEEALSDAKWHPQGSQDLEKTGVSVGGGIGCISEITEASGLLLQKRLRRLSPFFVPRILINMAAGHISMKYGFRGPNHAVVTACASGAHSIGDAYRMVSFGDADVMVAGGTECSIDALSIAGFSRKNELLECVRRRWDWFHKPIHAVAHLLHPLWRNEEAYLDNELEDNWLTYVKMWTGDDVHMIDQLEKERYAFRTNEKYFGNPTARLRENQLAPVTWWERFGLGTPLLRKLAIRVLSQDCSTGPAERNWSTWALFHTKKRNRLSSEQLERLVYCHCNLKLLEKKGNYTHPLQVNVDTIDISDVKDIPEIPHEERDIYSMLFKEQQRFVRQTRSKTSRAKACGNIMEASTSRHPRKFASRRGGGRGRRGASTSRHVDGPQDWDEISAESRSDEDLDEAAATIAAQFGLDSESSSWTSAFDEDEDEDLDEDVDSRV